MKFPSGWWFSDTIRTATSDRTIQRCGLRVEGEGECVHSWRRSVNNGNADFRRRGTAKLEFLPWTLVQLEVLPMLNARQYSGHTPSRPVRATRWSARRLNRHCRHDCSNSRCRAIQDEPLDLAAKSRPHSSAEIRQKAWKCRESLGQLAMVLSSVEPPSYSARWRR